MATLRCLPFSIDLPGVSNTSYSLFRSSAIRSSVHNIYIDLETTKLSQSSCRQVRRMRIIQYTSRLDMFACCFRRHLNFLSCFIKSFTVQSRTKATQIVILYNQNFIMNSRAPFFFTLEWAIVFTLRAVCNVAIQNSTSHVFTNFSIQRCDAAYALLQSNVDEITYHIDMNVQISQAHNQLGYSAKHIKIPLRSDCQEKYTSTWVL